MRAFGNETPGGGWPSPKVEVGKKKARACNELEKEAWRISYVR